MSAENFKAVEKSQVKMRAIKPGWLNKQQVPSFDYVQVGEGEVNLVLLHGLFGTVSNWDALIPLCSKFCKVTALNFPILEGKRKEVGVKELALYTEMFIRENFDKPVVLCGNSLGGHVSLRIALASPDLVSSLILSGSSGLYEHTVDRLPVRPDAIFVREHMGRVFYDDKYVTADSVKEVLDLLDVRKHQINIIHAAKTAKRDNMGGQLVNIKTDTLLLWGKDDHVTPMDVAESFSNLLPNSRLETISGCGHAPMIEKPDWFSKQVKSFIEG